MFNYNWPLIVGACIAVVAGELLVWNMSRKSENQTLAINEQEVVHEN